MRRPAPISTGPPSSQAGGGEDLSQPVAGSFKPHVPLRWWSGSGTVTSASCTETWPTPTATSSAAWRSSLLSPGRRCSVSAVPALRPKVAQDLGKGALCWRGLERQGLSIPPKAFQRAGRGLGDGLVLQMEEPWFRGASPSLCVQPFNTPDLPVPLAPFSR